MNGSAPRAPGRRLFAQALLLGMAALLSACAVPRAPSAPEDKVWSGRLALRVDSDPPQSFSAGFDLRGTPAAGELQLSTPLGNTVAEVRWSALGAELRQGQEVKRRASLDKLTTELSGTALPVGALFGWLRGERVDTPGWTADLSLHAEGRITARRTSPLPGAELRLLFQP